MKSNVIIKMGASRWDVIVKGADGKPVVFDLYHMDKEQRRKFHNHMDKEQRRKFHNHMDRRKFHKEFMKAWRAS